MDHIKLKRDNSIAMSDFQGPARKKRFELGHKLLKPTFLIF